MTPFLSQVAQYSFQKYEKLDRTCFIFPNKRAEKFFRKYLAEEVSRHSSKPMKAPLTMTMNDFFYRLAGASQTDRVQLLLELYGCYAKINQKAESLDDFIFWGDVLLGDFDDVDKYLVDPGKIFANVADFRKLQDDWDCLSDDQKVAIERFLSHFKTGGSIKDNFLKIWTLLRRLYEDFNATLNAKGLSYEGKVYRSIAGRLESESVVDMLDSRFHDSYSYVFVGLNALNECEKKLMRRMRDARIAEFCWDYSGKLIKDRMNKSSFFLDANVAEFPQAFRPDPDGLPEPKFNILSVPSSVGQAKQLPEILRRIAEGDGRVPGLDTAIVLPDEKLLLPVLNSIPTEVEKLNVTMGYPMGGCELWPLMSDIASLQMHTRTKDGKLMFYHKQVWAIFSNSVFKTSIDEAGREIVDEVRKNAKYYIPQEDLNGSPVLDLIFRQAFTPNATPDAGVIKAIEEYQMELLAGIAGVIKNDGEMSLEVDFAKTIYDTVERLHSFDLELMPASYFRLLAQLLANSSVPFEGEPLQGLQIMGPLETRALDFDNVVILSCNEGVFPRRSVSSSFIPPELRKGFGLPTYEYQDAVWAYYFYRLIQRAKNVWMLYNSHTEGVKTGEMSRYIRQLELHFGVELTKYVATADVGCGKQDESICKTQEHIDILHSGTLSASALKNYLDCPAKFYYHSVCRLKEEENVSESLDAGMLGTVFHLTMEELYSGHPVIGKAYLQALLKDSEGIRRIVDKHIMDQLCSIEVSGRNIIFRDVICQWVRKVLQRDLELLGRYGKQEFKILGLELKQDARIGDFDFIGYIDRLDSFEDGEVRIVDYKTGSVSDKDFLITEENAATVVTDLFKPDSKNRPKIALQLYLYDYFIQHSDYGRGKHLVNSIYQPSRLFVNEIENVALNDKFCNLMKDGVEKLLEEISDLSKDWKKCNDEDICKKCDFKLICGR